MKTKDILKTTVICLAVLALAAGCGKKEEVPEASKIPGVVTDGADINSENAAQPEGSEEAEGTENKSAQAAKKGDKASPSTAPGKNAEKKGSSNEAGSSSEEPKEVSKRWDIEAFQKIELDMKVAEVEKALGVKGESQKGGVWQWNNDGQGVYANTKKDKLSAKFLLVEDYRNYLYPDTDITKKEELKEGMSLSEIEKIIGSPGVPFSEGDIAGIGIYYKTYKWYAENGEYLNIQFGKDGKASIITSAK